MQPSPSAETSGPERPNFLNFIECLRKLGWMFAGEERFVGLRILSIASRSIEILGGDCGESAKAGSQFCRKSLATALGVWRRGSESGQTGKDYARNVAETIAFGDLGDFSEIAFSQCGCGVADKPTGLLAGFAVVIETLADDGNRVNQHQ